jgi:hypothetical protein
MRAPGRPGEPQSTGGEQRRYCQEQMFSFHVFPFRTLRYGIVRGFLELAFDLERRRGILVRSASEQE